MSRRNIIYSILFILCLGINSCGSDEPQEIFLKKSHSGDSITDKDGNKILFGKVTVFKKLDDSRILIADSDVKAIYVTDMNFNLLTEYDLSKFDFMIKGLFKDVVLRKGSLYILDNSWQILRYNINDKNLTSIIPETFDRYRSHINNIEFLSDTIFVLTGTLFRFQPTSNDSIGIGGIYSSSGKIIKSIRVTYNDLKHTYKSDESFVNLYNEKIYFAFNYSTQILIYDTKGERLGQLELIPDTHRKFKKQEGKLHVVFDGPMNIIDDHIFYFESRAPRQEITIKKYDMNIKEIERYVSTEPVPGSIYAAIPHEDKFLLCNSFPLDNSFYYVYEK